MDMAFTATTTGIGIATDLQQGIIDRFQRSKRNAAKYELMIEDLRQTVDRKGKRKSNVERETTLLTKNELEYVRVKEDFFDAEQLLARAFYTLSENLVRFAKFHLIDADDALQEGVVICFEKIDRFDPEKGKAFNYMTTCILNHFRQLYRSAINYNELKKKYHEFLSFCENRIIIKNGKELPFYESRSHF